MTTMTKAFEMRQRAIELCNEYQQELEKVLVEYFHLFGLTPYQSHLLAEME